MAFSFRKIISNIPYFKRGEDGDSPDSIATIKRRHASSSTTGESSKSDSPEKPNYSTTNLKSFKKTASSTSTVKARSSSLSETDLLKVSITPPPKKGRRKTKKLRLDIERANKSTDDVLNLTADDFYNKRGVENTPVQATIGARSAEIFSERLKEFDLNKSFDIFDLMYDEKLLDDNYDVRSISENSDSDISDINPEEVKMCRKAEPLNDTSSTDRNIGHTSSMESFADVELDRNEDERITLLLSYQMRLEKMERLFKKLLSEFQFHIEVSKVFHCKSMVTTLAGTDVSNIPKILGDVTYIDNVSRGVSPANSWNIVMEKEDSLTKYKLRKQLLSIKHCIDEFVKIYLQETQEIVRKPDVKSNQKSITFGESKTIKKKRLRVNKKKRDKRIGEFPDWRDALQCLFDEQDITTPDTSLQVNDITDIHDLDELENKGCQCNCHMHHSSTQSDSGLTSKSDDKSNQSITSSLGNFSLDSTSLSAYSESLENVLSYNSFHDTSLCSTLLQKAAIERITFYVQVHGIQLKGDENESFESKNSVTFNCHACSVSERNEQDLLKHIISQRHCEKIHFLYKTAYIKKCLATAKEILPSTVLNPMTMYRDDNKIVCFGDGMFACSLCFENMIIGESVLMSHCAMPDHLERKERLAEFLE